MAILFLRVCCDFFYANSFDLFRRRAEFHSGALSDIRLPHIDGIALTRAIKRMKPETAIVAATGHGQHARNLELESLEVAHLTGQTIRDPKVTGYTPER